MVSDQDFKGGIGCKSFCSDFNGSSIRPLLVFFLDFLMGDPCIIAFCLGESFKTYPFQKEQCYAYQIFTPKLNHK